MEATFEALSNYFSSAPRTRWLKDNFAKRIDLIVIALFPLLYVATDSSFGQNQAGDIDTWFYYGLAKSFWYHLPLDFSNDYYETRLPYIVPAAIIFAIPSDKVASILFSFIQYYACALSLFYVLLWHVSRSAAFLVTLLMASNIYFMRAVGWQYVDGGVLAYCGLTFAALTAATGSRHKYAFVALSGFLFTSMIIVHLGSAPLGLALLGYAIFSLDMTRLPLRQFFGLVLFAMLGVIVCQGIYGLLNMFLYHTNFLFEMLQFRVGEVTESEPEYFTPLEVVFTSGWWLVLPTAVWISSAAMIVAWLMRVFSPSRFQVFCMWLVFSLYLIMFLTDYLDLTYFLRRQGLYISFFLFLSYMFIGSIIPRGIGKPVALIIGAVFVLCLMLHWVAGPAVAAVFHGASVLAIAATLGLVLMTLLLATKTRRLVHMVLVPIAAALFSLPIAWPFAYQPDVYAARRAIIRVIGDSLPYLAFSRSDLFTIAGLSGSFTPRAWWAACKSFPNCQASSIGRRQMFVLSSNNDAEEIDKIASAGMPQLTLSKADVIYRGPGRDFPAFTVYAVRIGQWLIPGSQLPSLTGRIEGSARVAAEGAVATTLTYGPYANLDPGRYEIRIQYESDGEAGSWDVVSGINDTHVLSRGPIPDSHGAPAEIATRIELGNEVTNFQARTWYSGRGRLSVLGLDIRLLAEP